MRKKKYIDWLATINGLVLVCLFWSLFPLHFTFICNFNKNPWNRFSYLEKIQKKWVILGHQSKQEMKTDLKPWSQISKSNVLFCKTYHLLLEKHTDHRDRTFLFQDYLVPHVHLPYCLRVSMVSGQNVSASIISGPLSGTSCKRRLLDWAAGGEEKTHRC